MTWTKLSGTPMETHVQNMMSDLRLRYHNFDHITALYASAENKQIEYCAELDCAILWHDAVYDEFPDKELRSAEAMRQAAIDHPDWFSGIDVDIAYNMIMNTAGHIYSENVDPALIYLDLGDLTCPDKRLENYGNILMESINLYGITVSESAQGTLDFMQTFVIDVERNVYLDQKNAKFWNDVADGCRDTIVMAKTTLQLYKLGYLS